MTSVENAGSDRANRLGAHLAVAVLLIGASLTQSETAAAANCGPGDYRDGTCPPPTVDGSTGRDGVDLIGTVTDPGSGGAGAESGSGATIPGQPVAPPPPPLRDGYGVTPPATPSVTLIDLINFRPAPGVLQMEPNGWMVVGLDTNFYTTVSTTVESGSLLGQPASVRFTPVRYHWAYGDGTTQTGSTRGATWASTGAAEFDRTETSHVYRAAGTYEIDLTIDFAAEYQFAGGSWIALDGVVPSATNRLTAAAGSANTVLVAKDCRENPSARGC